MLVSDKISLQSQQAFRHGRIYLIDDRPDCALIEAASGYIPKRSFQEMFEALGEIVQERNIRRVIFDKSELTVFHQPSMEWYFLVWKEKMFDCGLKVHRKILPDDLIFRESARIAREKLSRTHPYAKFNTMDIKYSRSVFEALTD